MNDYNNELYFLANIYDKPELIKQIVIPMECIRNDLNRFILQTFIYSYKQSGTINLPTLLEENQKGFKGKYNDKEYMQRVSQIIDLNNYDITDFDYYQQLLFEDYKEELLKQVINDFQQNKLNQDELYNKIHSIEARTIDTTTGYKTVDEIKDLVITNNKTIPFRLEKLSKRIKLQEHDLMVISARTGIGKSGFALNLLEDLSKKHKCILFNMEMSESSVYKRLISIMTTIPMDSLSTPKSDRQQRVIDYACEQLSKRKLKIISRGQTIQSIRREIINEQRDEHLMVFIDYVGLIGSTEKHKSLYELITSVVKELRNISMSYNCTIFLLAQINRSGEDNPKLSDLKESGELEQSATQVIILNAEETNEDEQVVELTLAKHREGKKAKLNLIYNRTNQIFEEE
jgi:replicative DNA helicase